MVLINNPHFVIFTTNILGKEFKDVKYPHIIFAFKNKPGRQKYILNTL